MLDSFRVVPKRRVVKLKGKKRAVVYNNPRPFYKFVFYLTDLVIVGGISFLIYLYLPMAEVAITFANSPKDEQSRVQKEELAIEKPAETMKETKMTVPERFKIDIPKIGADTWVVTNVSAFDAADYNAILEDNVIAHAKDSGLPGGGMGTSIYLFAHSSEPTVKSIRSNPVFYLLGEMKNEDKIVVDYNGQKYIYKVYDRKITKPTDIDYLTYSDPAREVIILQTCWPVGTNWNRLLVFGELVKE